MPRVQVESRKVFDAAVGFLVKIAFPAALMGDFNRRLIASYRAVFGDEGAEDGRCERRKGR